MSKIKIVILVIVVILIGFFGYLILKPERVELSQDQKEKALTKLLGRKVDLSEKKKSGDSKFEGKYAEFLHPGSAVIYDYKDPSFASSSSLLESFSYDIHDPRVVFNFTVNNKNISSVSEDPAVVLRRMKDRGYTEGDIKLDGATGVTFERYASDGSEYDIFVYRDKLLYSMILLGPDEKYLRSLVDLLVSSFKFNN